jgi:hypothetical protein
MLSATQMLFLNSVYIANILVAGFVGITALFFPEFSARYVLEGVSAAVPPYTSLRIVGSLWSAITVLSVLGLWVSPETYSVVLLLQLLYKGSWLLVVALPAMLRGQGHTLPMGMTWFFLAWVLILPWVIPYKFLGLL